MQFEPALVMREAVVMAQFTNMVNKRAKTPSETKALLVELDERAKRVEEITGERIENRHMMSVVMGVLDSESMKHTAQFQGAKVRADVLKRKVVEFANLKFYRGQVDGFNGYWQVREDVVGGCYRRLGRGRWVRLVSSGYRRYKCSIVGSGYKMLLMWWYWAFCNRAPEQGGWFWKRRRRQERKGLQRRQGLWKRKMWKELRWQVRW